MLPRPSNPNVSYKGTTKFQAELNAENSNMKQIERYTVFITPAL